MRKGKILKIRIGHEANCSSGMVVALMLMVGGVTYLPLSLITAAVQASKLRADVAQTGKRIRYWVVPQVLGLGVTAFLVDMAFTSGYATTGLPINIALAMGLSFALSVTAGYTLAPRIGYSICVVAPLILVVGYVGFFEFIRAWVVLLLGVVEVR